MQTEKKEQQELPDSLIELGELSTVLFEQIAIVKCRKERKQLKEKYNFVAQAYNNQVKFKALKII